MDDYDRVCPNCGNDDITISNDEGYECDECNCKWDTEPDGNLLWLED